MPASLFLFALLATLAGAVEDYNLYADQFVKYYTGCTGATATCGTVQGYVGPLTTTSGVQKFNYHLYGADSSCGTAGPGTASNSCGLHIHEGNSCSSDAGGHFYSNGGGVTTDPWTAVGYEADTSGNSKGYLEVYTGGSQEEVKGKVIIVHNYAGSRIACAPLFQKIFIERLASIPRVTKDNCANWQAIKAGTVKAKPAMDYTYYAGNFPTAAQKAHQAANTLRSLPILTYMNCVKAGFLKYTNSTTMYGVTYDASNVPQPHPY